jgi:hypothetical protein
LSGLVRAALVLAGVAVTLAPAEALMLPAGQAWDPAYPQRRIAALAAAHGIRHLSLLPILRTSGAAAPLYFARNSHGTAAGHRVVGAAIARALADVFASGG